ncbi:uncharacterized protein LOC101767827 isoform X1 [Setaria italica]|uniref:uncharacterized protein LOC101767827 isoform X1 n=1 Tax=Setaria italica TaxID=4555 RepID=UPI000BE5DF00|nr:uncharacterized protein LOC101767827 isoform X1 [Setaria italica]
MLCIHVRHRVSPNSRKVPEQGQMHSGKQQRGLFVLDVLAEKERKEQRDLPIQKGPNLLGEGNHVHVVSVLSIAQFKVNRPHQTSSQESAATEINLKVHLHTSDIPFSGAIISVYEVSGNSYLFTN